MLALYKTVIPIPGYLELELILKVTLWYFYIGKQLSFTSPTVCQDQNTVNDQFKLICKYDTANMNNYPLFFKAKDISIAEIRLMLSVFEFIVFS